MNEARTQINNIDEQLVGLFRQRMDAALNIAKYKREKGLPVLDRTRERQVLYRVAELAGEDLERYARQLYATLFDVSRSHQRNHIALESPMRAKIDAALCAGLSEFPTKATVACQGVEGAYSQQACDKMFPFASILYFNNFDGVFQAVEKGMCRYGVLPIENSAQGSVTQVYDLMERHKFSIVRGIRQRIDHALLAKPGVKLSDIREIYSHPQGIAQCGAFLRDHPQVAAVPTENTAVSAKRVAESERTDIAAIASRSCAELYGLTIVSDAISDTDNNYTRFIVISRDMEVYPDANKISMSLSLPHEPGSLYAMLGRFASLGINLTKLESRPIPGREFEFRFHFDIEARLDKPEIVNLLCEIQLNSEHFVLLGNFREGY